MEELKDVFNVYASKMNLRVIIPNTLVSVYNILCMVISLFKGPSTYTTSF